MDILCLHVPVTLKLIYVYGVYLCACACTCEVQLAGTASLLPGGSWGMNSGFIRFGKLVPLPDEPSC